MIPRISILILVTGLLLSGCSSVVSTNNELLYQEFYFVTTRKDTGSEEAHKRFSSERGETSYGVAMVAIEPDKTYASFANAQPNHILQQSEPLGKSRLQQVKVLDKERFFDCRDNYYKGEAVPGEILVYTHGYKMGFTKTAWITAQLRYELAFPGPVIAFSWPSTNNLAGYAADMENMAWSGTEFRNLLNELVTRYPGATIHVIAHSMGNKILIDAILQLRETYPDDSDWPLGEIVMIAPDIDRQTFEKDVAGRLFDIPSRKTLYVSSKDFPLFASATIYTYPRLGDARDGPPIIDGIDTVDVSDAIPMFDGHGYYEANRETIDDLYYIIREGREADDRPTLMETKIAEGTYWRLIPNE
jgi:esterase/lipase superfamily enzyme